VIRIVRVDDPTQVNYTYGSRILQWSPDVTFTMGGGVESDACADLYHEFMHAADDLNHTDSNDECDSTGIATDEVKATFAENDYRRARGLPVRKSYSGHTLPKRLEEVQDPAEPPSGHPGVQGTGRAEGVRHQQRRPAPVDVRPVPLRPAGGR
jgi:hypothetical protein